MVRIAIVEDERPFAEQLEGYIRRYGQSKGINYKISVFTNGIDLISAPEPSDIVFLDIEMPLMDGLTAANNIRHLSNADAETVPIIAMTANAFAEDVREAMDAGMTAHVAKPIDVEVLRETLKKVLIEKKE